MNRKTMLQAVLLCSLSLSPVWVMAETAVTTLPLDTSAKDGLEMNDRIAGSDSAPSPVAMRRAITDEEVSVDCFYGENASHPSCADTKGFPSVRE